ncbi:acyl carrier protein [Zobellia barbeyronii]|uniref:Acyl carrier protein n=1 Tax=Zobellia barbeyronii TaxID=2748009 RepID=A0ABS5WJZ3_9FLAO|nr:acyl carrier protein [Zobellia barbeyronii]MBT2163180.1 acyl carrier protein [Zobellia barbeyronii]
MKNKIISYIKSKLATEVVEEIDINEDLLGSGLVDSLGMVQLVLFIENEANIKVAPEDMTIENFMTVNHILKYIARK